MPLSGQCSPRRVELSDQSRMLIRKYFGLLSFNAWRQHDGWLARLITGGGKAAAVQAAGMLLTFAVNILLARAAGVEGYGTYSFVLALASFAAVCGRLGMDTAVLRFVPEYTTARNWAALKGLLKSSAGLVTAASVLGALVVSGIVILMGRWSAEDCGLMALALLFLVPALAFTSLTQGLLRGFYWAGRAMLGDNIIRPVLLALGVAAGWRLYTSVMPATTLLLLAAGACCVAVAVAWAWVRQAERQLVPPDTAAAYSNRKWLGVAMPLFAIGALNVTLARADVVLVGALSNAREVGYYAVAARIAVLVSFGLGALNVIVAPMISELYASSRYQEMRRLLNIVIRLGSLAGVAVAILFVFLGGWLLNWFGVGFEDGWRPLVLLTLGQVVNVAFGPVGYLLAMTGSHRQAFWILAQGAVLNVVVGIVGVLLWGAVGAALATSLAMTWWNVAMAWHASKRFGFSIIPFYGVRGNQT